MRNFLKNSKAATAIEFAIIAPVFFLLFVGIIEFGVTMFMDSSLNTAIRTVARQGVPGPAYTDMTPINNMMLSNTGGMWNPDPDHNKFIMLSFDNFSDPAFAAARDSFLAGPEAFFASHSSVTPGTVTQSNKIIIYGVQYKWGGITGLMGPFIPKYLYAFSIVRDEQF